jgi:putative DNA primase/helicase
VDNEKLEGIQEGFIKKKSDEIGVETETRELLESDLPDFDSLVSKLISKEVSYYDACKKFIKYQPLYYDSSCIWWAWNKDTKRWQIIDETDVMNLLFKALSWSYILYPSIKALFFNALKMASRDNKPLDYHPNYIQFKDKIVNVLSGSELTPSSKYFLTNPLPYKLGDNDDTPKMDEIFSKWVGGENVRHLYEIISYCLYRDYPIQRIFVVLGSGSNGKGSFLRLLRKFLGADNITSTNLEKIEDSRFETAKMYKKLVCEIAETNVSLLRYTSSIKRLTGGDFVNAEFKGKNPFDFVNYAKLVIATNSLPMTRDNTEGFYRRWNIIEFPNKFLDGHEITNDIPDYEYENLGKKCVKILKTLLERGQFSNDGTIEARMERYERFSNPVREFINKFYEKNVDGYVKKQDFNEKLWNWTRDNGFRTLSEREINKVLINIGYEIKGHYIQELDCEKTVKCILGLSRKDITDITSITDIPISPPIIRELSREIGKTSNTGKERLESDYSLNSEVLYQEEKIKKDKVLDLRYNGSSVLPEDKEEIQKVFQE